jgi:hypothetical protein
LIHIKARSPGFGLNSSHATGATGEKVASISATEIAGRHFSAAMAEAEAAGQGTDSICRAMLGLVISKYLESRGVSDVQSELRFVAENCDPDTDFMFMRP